MANNFQVRDAAGVTKTFKSTETAAVHSPHHNIDTMLPGTTATALGKAEDAVHASGDVGVYLLAVRKAVPANTSGADGDYEGVQVDNGLLWTRGVTKRSVVSVTPTVSTSPAYTAGDLVGGKMTFANVIRAASESSILRQVIITDLAMQSAELDLILFDADPSGTTFTDNAAFDIADADLVKIIGILTLAAADYAAFVDSSAGIITSQLGIVPASGTSLYGALVTRGTPTFAGTTDVTVRLVLEVA
jgi:hypothetical protein